jgi:hypothetical protein
LVSALKGARSSCSETAKAHASDPCQRSRGRRSAEAHGASAQEGKWLDPARGIEGKSLAKTAQLCGVHPMTTFNLRHRFLRVPGNDRPRGLRGIVEADETLILESFKGRWSDLPRASRANGRQGQASRGLSGHFSCRRPASGRRASIVGELAGIVPPGHLLIGDAAARPQSRLPITPRPRRPNWPRSAALHINGIGSKRRAAPQALCI